MQKWCPEPLLPDRRDDGGLRGRRRRAPASGRCSGPRPGSRTSRTCSASSRATSGPSWWTWWRSTCAPSTSPARGEVAQLAAHQPADLATARASWRGCAGDLRGNGGRRLRAGRRGDLADAAVAPGRATRGEAGARARRRRHGRADARRRDHPLQGGARRAARGDLPSGRRRSVRPVSPNCARGCASARSRKTGASPAAAAWSGPATSSGTPRSQRQLVGPGGGRARGPAGGAPRRRRGRGDGRLSWAECRDQVRDCDPVRQVGRVTDRVGMVVEVSHLQAPVGALCRIEMGRGRDAGARRGGRLPPRAAAGDAVRGGPGPRARARGDGAGQPPHGAHRAGSCSAACSTASGEPIDGGPPLGRLPRRPLASTPLRAMEPPALHRPADHRRARHRRPGHRRPAASAWASSPAAASASRCCWACSPATRRWT